MGVDMALTTTTCGANGLDADGVGCSEWTFESKLTDYAEYPPSDGVSSPCVTTRSVKCRHQALKGRARAALRPTFAAQGCKIFRYMSAGNPPQSHSDAFAGRTWLRSMPSRPPPTAGSR